MRPTCRVMAVVLGVAALLLPSALGGERAEAKFKIEKADEYDPLIDPADFVDAYGDPLPIDNLYMPLVPGTSYLYEGETEDGIEEILMYVTHETKDILGVPCTVVHETEWVDGVLAEDTFDWFAQDVSGHVWYFGEFTVAYEPGEPPSTEGSWEAGVDRAKPGIVMLADPRSGDAYRQEYYEGEAEDLAKVLNTDVSVSIAYGDFDGCLRTKEWTPLEPGSVEHKHYAPGIGLVLVRELTGGTVEIELVGIAAE